MKVGWYPDPDDPGARRYWDGETWSEPLSQAVRPKPAPPAAPPSPWAAPAMPTSDALAGGDPVYLNETPPASPEPEAATSSHKRRWLLLAALVIVLAIAGGVTAFFALRGDDEPNNFTAYGTITLTDFDGYSSDTSSGDLGADCEGKSGYDDITTGASVTISDDGKDTLALTELEQGTTTEEGCSFSFRAEIPRGRKTYGVEVTHRGIVRETEQDLDSGVSLTLG